MVLALAEWLSGELLLRKSDTVLVSAIGTKKASRKAAIYCNTTYSVRLRELRIKT